MAFLGQLKKDYERLDNYQDGEAKKDFTPEDIANAAAFAAIKAFETRQRQEGKPVSHAFAKEQLTGISDAEVDKAIETKALNDFDCLELKNLTKKRCERWYEAQYESSYDEYDPNTSPLPDGLEG